MAEEAAPLLEPTMLTTKDNPYNPAENYDQWLMWDQNNGYYTNEYLARIASSYVDYDALDLEQVLELAKIEILETNVMNDLYRLVSIGQTKQT